MDLGRYIVGNLVAWSKKGFSNFPINEFWDLQFNKRNPPFVKKEAINKGTLIYFREPNVKDISENLLYKLWSRMCIFNLS